ncbi:N-glycosylase/DNA lyase [Candidatus Woesearchaeota archaeon]|nr:N-glycosylase/DNA lyase [Candidatus Woesearchaeota archaeon]
MKLINEIKKLEKSNIKKKIKSRLNEFSSFKNKPNDEWFSELCFCILTANSKARTAIAIQKELGHEGFLHHSMKELIECIKRNKHRFHNNKARFIHEARKYQKIKDILRGKSSVESREWLVKNIKGIGCKEASHFLRNVGYFDLAILDRHVLNLMLENKIIKEKPKSLTKKNYFEIEEKFNSLAKKANMSIAELDLNMWYLKAGDVLK